MNLFYFLASLAVAVWLFLFWKRWKQENEKKSFRDRMENVYLVACHPKTNAPPWLGEMSPFASFVPYYEVMEERKRVVGLLEESGNRFWKNERLKKKHRLQIVVYLFRDGEFVNESFDEYSERVAASIKQDRAVRHAALKSLSESWYLVKWHSQNCVEWKKGLD